MRQSQVKNELLQKEFTRTSNIMKDICYADGKMIYPIYKYRF